MQVTVFYAWQSDCPKRLNQAFIRHALEEACAAINADQSTSWNVRIDSGAEGVVGMCDIPNEILKKIEACDIFVGDLTLVGTTAEGKKLPNSNVVFELGFAAKNLGFERLIGVMNEAYGRIDGQIFDIKRRSSLMYELLENCSPDEIKRRKKTLANELKSIIAETITKVILPLRSKKGKKPEADILQLQKFYSHHVRNLDHYGIKQPAVLYTILFDKPTKAMFDRMLWEYRDAGEVLHFSPHGLAWREGWTVGELMERGVLRRASTQDTVAVNFAIRKDKEPKADFLFGATLQSNLLQNIANDLNTLRELGIAPPWQIACSLVGAYERRLLDTANEESRQVIKQNDIALPVVTITSGDDIDDMSVLAGRFREGFDYLCKFGGEMASDCYDEDGRWNM